MLSLYPHYVGMGLFLAWTVGNSFVLNFAETSAIENARSVDLLCGMAANILALFVIACRSDEIGSLLARRRCAPRWDRASSCWPACCRRAR